MNAGPQLLLLGLAHLTGGGQCRSMVEKKGNSADGGLFGESGIDMDAGSPRPVLYPEHPESAYLWAQRASTEAAGRPTPTATTNGQSHRLSVQSQQGKPVRARYPDSDPPRMEGSREPPELDRVLLRALEAAEKT